VKRFISSSWRSTFDLIESSRFGPLYLAALIYLVISSATRLVLFAVASSQTQIDASQLAAILPIGLFYDFVTCLYLFTPFALYLFLIPERLYKTRLQRGFFLLVYFASVFGLLYIGAAEYFFFDEFNSRFNFIAVEYLIYPHEVFVNIWQSYPVWQIILLTLAITLGLTWYVRPTLKKSIAIRSTYKTRLVPLAVFGGLLALAHVCVNINTGRYSENRVANELAQNGIYAFFNAAANSVLDYPQYYKTVPDDEAIARLRYMVKQPNSTFIEGALNPIARHINNSGTTKYLNVIVLLQESLGAEFVGRYGDKRNLTPNIDRIAQESIVFTNVYATGTRTVRGMEAVAASFPPVPAESIVKRSRNEKMFNWSTVMSASGYSPTFIYGGYGNFDNMNYYFGNNGYRVVDRTDMDEPTFSNIWGVSDEDAYRNAFRVYDEQHAHSEKIFSIIMSTSNHKPYTFPSGIPGVPSKGGGRDAGVKYSDYAIGRFFDALKTKPYYDDTVVIIIGDHGARVYGKEDIPVSSYELPLLVYAPKHFKPKQIDTLTSQIDLAPTILGLLNISYDSVFFGRDILKTPDNRFVLFNHNRDIALYQNDKIAELGFGKTSAMYQYKKGGPGQVKIDPDEEQIKNATSLFQSAYNFYLHQQYHLDEKPKLAQNSHVAHSN
jgi:phosphoglycerol transferase MdoB-like AlkP superfamily enzyme